MMKKSFGFVLLALTLVVLVSGCTSTKGLSDDAKKDPQTTIWYKNASLLVEANDPDLKADSQTGIKSVDAIMDVVKDIITITPKMVESRIETKHLNNVYDESIKAIYGNEDEYKLVVKGEAFKTYLLFETFREEAEHAKEAEEIKTELNNLTLKKSLTDLTDKNQEKEDAELKAKRIAELQAKRRENYAANSEVFEDAKANAIDYANNQIFKFVACQDDASREAFFNEPSRKVISESAKDIAEKIEKCVAAAREINEKAAKEDDKKVKESLQNKAKEENKKAKAALCKEMRVNEFNFSDDVLANLKADLEKITTVLTKDLPEAMQEPELQKSLAKAAFGGEVVPGVAGKETLAELNRFRKQLQVTSKMLGWLIGDLAN